MKTALITGASRGIGEATAYQLLHAVFRIWEDIAAQNSGKYHLIPCVTAPQEYPEPAKISRNLILR